ncbi:putative hydrolase LipZ [Styela clava]
MVLRQAFAVILGICAYIVGNSLLLKEESVSFEELPLEIQEWYKMGEFATIHGREIFYIHLKCADINLKNPPTFAIIHGFPSSSFEYHKVLRNLSKYGNVVVNDHIGFGFSDVPKENYTYSLGEAAENVLALWRHLGIKRAHIVSHDMGDSILTEILARRDRKMLPSYFDDYFQSVTFTNGGMNFEMINFRITQTALMYPKIGKPLVSLVKVLGLRKFIFRKQVQSIWGPNIDEAEREKDIQNIMLINLYNGAIDISYKTIYYLWDRYHFEFRWFAALERLDIPSRFIWSDSDAVSPIKIPKSFQNMVPDFELAVIENCGHFWMLENPNRWVKEVIKILDK